MINRRFVCAVAMAASVAAAGCGSGKSSSTTSRVDFKTGFATSQKEFRALGTAIAKDITGAGTKTDAELATAFAGLARRADKQASQLAGLTVPAADAKRMTSLVAGFHGISADLSKISAAAKRHDASRAEAATRALLTDAAKIKTADTSLSKALGLPAAGASSSSSSSSASSSSSSTG